jgi:hypothetical protein
LIHGAIIVNLLIEAENWAIDHFLSRSEGESAKDDGEGEKDLFHDLKGGYLSIVEDKALLSQSSRGLTPF